MRRWKVEEAKRWGKMTYTFQEGVLTLKKEEIEEKGRGKQK
jgi:hypothetical protein